MRTTVGALGYSLPVGAFLPTGERARTFAFKAWRSADELELGKIRDRDRTMSSGVFTARVLAHFLTEWCGQPLASLAGPERLLMLNRAWAGDVYHAWMQLRREALGNDLDMRVTCGTCRAAFDYSVDLGSVEESTIDSADDLRVPHRLRDGVEIGGETRRAMTLEPLRWAIYESLGDSGPGLNIGAVKLGLVRGAAVALEGCNPEVPLPGGTWDDLTKFDLETLTARINDLQPGPTLAIETACPRCGSQVVRSISWTYDGFFSVRASGPGGTRAS